MRWNLSFKFVRCVQWEEFGVNLETTEKYSVFVHITQNITVIMYNMLFYPENSDNLDLNLAYIYNLRRYWLPLLWDPVYNFT